MRASPARAAASQLAPLAAPALAALPGLTHGFSTRAGGASSGVYASLNTGFGSGDVPMLVQENRDRFVAALGAAPARLATPRQVHSARVVVAEKPWAWADAPEADAVVTATPGLVLGVASADCGPILLADAGARVVAAAHAGWRGAVDGVIAATVDAMTRLGAAPARIVAVLGPTISQVNYEVGPDFLARLGPAHARFLAPAPREGHALFDLPGFIMDRLAAAGVGTAHDLGLCTYTDPARFFSFRRTTHEGGRECGRHLAAITLFG